MARKVYASYTKFQALARQLGPRLARALTTSPQDREAEEDGQDDRTTQVHREGRRRDGGHGGRRHRRCPLRHRPAQGPVANVDGVAPALDMHPGAAQRLAEVVEEMSGGRFRIEVFPGGQIMQPFDCFDAASKGTIEAFMGSPQYWSAKEPASSGSGPSPSA